MAWGCVDCVEFALARGAVQLVAVRALANLAVGEPVAASAATRAVAPQLLDEDVEAHRSLRGRDGGGACVLATSLPS